MNWLDYGAIGLYGAAMLIMGTWFARQQRSCRDYFLAGRSMGWLVLAISQIASVLSAISYVGAPGEAYGHDLRWLVFSVVSSLVFPLSIYLFVNFLYRLRIVSSFEYLEIRFNYPTRAMTSGFFILLRLSWMATIVSATSLVLNKLTGMPIWQCIVLTAVVSVAYTLLGGMKAIIWTDVIQFLLFTGGLVGALIMIGLADAPGELLRVLTRDNNSAARLYV